VKHAAPIDSWEQTKLLADARRLRLLRLLMARPATLTQLAEQVGKSPAWVRHHIQQLERAGLVTLAEVRQRGRVREKYYRATAGAWVLQRLVLPESDHPVVVFAGSHDLALEQLAQDLAPHLEIVLHPVGSLDGLVNLRQHLCHFTGAHLLDETGLYNTPYVRRLFPAHDVRLMTLAHRVQGLMVAAGNPLGIRDLHDLLRADVRFVNRNPGSGTRLWLDARLQELGLDAAQVQGYTHEVDTHTAAAQAVASGKADVALGLEAAAARYGLDFIPLFAERFDLVFPQQETRELAPLLDALQTARFRRFLTQMRGYNPAHTGEEVAV